MWQVSVLMRNGAVMLFGVVAQNDIEAERLVFARAPSGTITSLAVRQILKPTSRVRISE